MSLSLVELVSSLFSPSEDAPTCPGELPTDHEYPKNAPITDEYNFDYKLAYANKLRCEGNYMEAKKVLVGAKIFVDKKCEEGADSCQNLRSIQNKKLPLYEKELEYDWLALYQAEIDTKKKLIAAPAEELKNYQDRLVSIRNGRRLLQEFDEKLKLPSISHTPIRQRVRQKIIKAALSADKELWMELEKEVRALEVIAAHEALHLKATMKYLDHVPALSSFHGYYQFNKTTQDLVNLRIQNIIPYDTSDLQDIGPFEPPPKDLEKIKLFEKVNKLKLLNQRGFPTDLSKVTKLMMEEDLDYEQARARVLKEERHQWKKIHSAIWLIGQGLNSRKNLFMARNNYPTLKEGVQYSYRIPGLGSIDPQDITIDQVLEQVWDSNEALVEFLEFENQFFKKEIEDNLKKDPMVRANFVFSAAKILTLLSYVQGKAVMGFPALEGRTDQPAIEELIFRQMNFEREGGERDLLKKELLWIFDHIEEVYSHDFEELKKKYEKKHPFLDFAFLNSDEKWEAALKDRSKEGILMRAEDAGFFDGARDSLISLVGGSAVLEELKKETQKFFGDPDLDWKVLKKHKKRLDEFKFKKEILLLRTELAESPQDFKEVFSELEPHLVYQLDHSFTELIKNGKELARAGDRTPTEDERIQLKQFEERYKEIKNIEEPEKRREALGTLIAEFQQFYFGLSLIQEIRIIDQCKGVSSKWGTLKGGIREMTGTATFGLINTSKNYHEGIQKDFSEYKSQLRKALNLFEEFQELRKAGRVEEADKKLKQAHNIWKALKHSKQRQKIIKRAKSSQKWFALTVGIGIVAISLASMGIASAALAPEAVGTVGFLTSLKGFTIGTTAFFLTYKLGAHLFFDQPFFGRSGTFWGSAKHLFTGWVEEMLFFGALNVLGAGYIRLLQRALKPGAKAIYMAEATGVAGAKTLPKAAFESLPKAVQQEYLFKYYEKISRVKRGGVWLGGHGTNFLGLHGWQTLSSPGYNPFGSEENIQLGAFMIALMPMGPIMERYLSPIRMRKVIDCQDQYKEINQQEIQWQNDYLDFMEYRQSLVNDPGISLTPRARRELRADHVKLIERYQAYMGKKIAFMEKYGNDLYQRELSKDLSKHYYQQEMQMRMMAEYDGLNPKIVGRDPEGNWFYNVKNSQRAVEEIPKIFGLGAELSPEISLSVHPNGMIEVRVLVFGKDISFPSGSIWIRPKGRISKTEIRAMQRKLEKMRKESERIRGRVIDIEPGEEKKSAASKR